MPPPPKHNAVYGKRDDDNLPEQPVVIWPEWSENEVAAEKWNTKHAFEDPEGMVWLPRSLRKLVDSTKRPNEIIGEGQPPIIVQSVAGMDELFQAQTPLSVSPFSAAASGVHLGTAGRLEAVTSLDGSAVLPASRDSLFSASAGFASGATGVQRAGDHGLQAMPELPERVSVTADAGGDPTASLNRNRGSISPSIVSTVASDSNTNLAASAQDTGVEESSVLPQNQQKKETPTGPSISVPATSTNSTKDPTNDNHPESLVGTSKFFQSNKHLLSSEFMRGLLAVLHFLHEQHKAAKAAPNLNEEFNPWDSIYPKAKDGVPTYNASGKYIVKLYWLGAWRKITIDDRIPVDVTGKPLFVSSPIVYELWPMLLCKALLKVANLRYCMT